MGAWHRSQPQSTKIFEASKAIYINDLWNPVGSRLPDETLSARGSHSETHITRLATKRFGMEPNGSSGKTGRPTPTLPEKDEAMLVLTRKPGEVIHVGDGIAIKVIKTGKGTVKIGIEAPADVKVLRGELSKKLDAEKSAGPDVSEEPKAVLFQKTAGRPVAVDFAGYFALPQTA